MPSPVDPIGGMRVSTSPDETPVFSTDSDPWVRRLQSTESDIRDAALAELRSILIRGLTKPMSQRYGGSLQAEDVVQEALMKIRDSLHQFAGRSKFTTWAMTVATRVGISEMRRKHYQDVSIEAFQNDDATRIEIAVDESVDAERKIDRQIMIDKLQKMIDSVLTEKQRFAIRASLEGLPMEVIAEKCGSNRNSIYKLVHDAKVKLRRAFEQAGIAADDFAATFA
ncbi:MAG: RNA polymerase sigma factor [Planctomycetota bacterium]